jgi:ribose 5-phosphate isomerase B
LRIAIGSDHAGFQLKDRLVSALLERGHEVDDLGAQSAEPVDYPHYARLVAQATAEGLCERGIVLGGSGNGEAIAANRVSGVRCTVCWDVESARLARAHNDANVLAMGARLLGEDQALAILDTWLTTPFDGGRHSRRIAQLDRPAGAAHH